MDRKYLFLGEAVIGAIILVIVLVFSLRQKPPEQITLNWVTYNEDENNLKEILADFESQNNVKINFIKKASQDYELESLNLLATGGIDIWGIPNNWLPKQKNKLAGNSNDIPYYQSIYPEIVQSENIVNNKIYGLPLAADPLVLFANNELKNNLKDLTDEERDLFKKVAKNWDDFLRQAQLLTKKNGRTITQAGAALGTASVNNASDILTALMLQNGTAMTNEAKTQATFHTALNTLGGQNYPGPAALDFYTSFGKADSPNYAFSDGLGDALTAFSQGKVAYLIDYASKEKEIKKLNSNLNYSISNLPQRKNSEKPVSLISYETFTVPNTSKHQDVAWQLLMTLTAKKNYSKYYSVSKKSPLFLEQIDAGDVAGIAILSAKSWYNPDPVKVQEIFRSAITEVLQGKSSQTALDGASLKVTALLGKLQQ